MITLPITPAAPEAELIARAGDILRRGGIVAYPTDTLYGLAVDPRAAEAVERLYVAKGRGAAAAMPLIAASIEQAAEVGIFGEAELALARAFWPGPLTIIVPATPTVARATLAGGATVAVRVPAHAVARALAAAFGFCITATSANLSGDRAAASVDEIAEALVAHVDIALDGGTVAGGPPSTIVEMATSGPRLVRAGAVPWNRVLESLE